jgi:hypothetical protein
MSGPTNVREIERYEEREREREGDEVRDLCKYIVTDTKTQACTHT